MAQRTTAEAVLALVGAVATLSAVRGWFPPPSGPRLRKGELGGRALSTKAAQVYWWSETEAQAGRCRSARKALDNAERIRERAEVRAAQGDHTVKDTRNSARAARAAVKQCKT